MSRYKDITGQTFWRLTVLYKLHNYHKKRRAYWLCVCECGNLTEVSYDNLKTNNTKSCGCYNKDVHMKHNKCNTRLYYILDNMKMRCYNKNNKDYQNYGARGIVVCDEWLHDFQAFHDWAMENGYRENLTIDRIDNNKGYSPDNCRWVDIKTQSRNTRRNRLITIGNETKSLAEWCEILNLNYHTIKQRLYRKWPIKKALELEDK